MTTGQQYSGDCDTVYVNSIKFILLHMLVLSCVFIWLYCLCFAYVIVFVCRVQTK